jgi:hypothetical protein
VLHNDFIELLHVYPTMAEVLKIAAISCRKDLWFRADVIGLFSNNVVSFSRNVVPSGPFSSRYT